jgi:predicted ArsR family transcriptional regulator
MPTKISNAAVPATHLLYSGNKSTFRRFQVAHQPDPKQLKSIYQAVEKHPGKRAGFIAQLLGLHRSQVNRTLPTMEERGYLLSEDERGRLWTYRRKR